jgi:hypothetical protein
MQLIRCLQTKQTRDNLCLPDFTICTTQAPVESEKEREREREREREKFTHTNEDTT